MPRIALVGPSWPYRGGISRTTTEAAAALARRGSLAAFLTAARQYPAFLYPGKRDVDPNACERLDVAEPVFGVLQPLSWRRLTRRLAETRADAIVMPYWTAAWAPMELWLARSGLAPIVGIVHNPCDHDSGWLSRASAAVVLRHFRAFFCHARSVAEGLQQQFPRTPVAVHPLASGSVSRADRAAARAALGVAGDATALLCFGLIRPYKGVDLLLEAMSRLDAGERVVLLLAGEPWGPLDGSSARTLERLVASGRAIARLEWIPEEDVATWFAAADVMVLPYRSATGSAVAAQALGHGLPLVASRVGGLAEVVEGGRAGVLVPPNDVAALAAALRQVLDPARRSALAAAARAAAEQWSWDSYASALEALVTDVG